MWNGAVRVRSKDLDGGLLYRLTNTSSVNNWLLDNAVGATMPNLNTSIVESIPLRVPQNASAVVALLDEIDKLIEGLTEMTIRVKNLRAGLLSKLLSGEHEIPESYDRYLRAA